MNNTPHSPDSETRPNPASIHPFRRWDGRDIPWLRSPWFLGLLLTLVVIALYTNSLRGEWIYDDYADILGNETVQRLWPLGDHFFQRVGTQLSVHPRPLVSLSFALNFLFGRNDPFLFHVTNVAIHALASLCLFGLVRRTLLLQPGTTWTPPTISLLAFMIALLWGIHPLQTEAVAYITQRYESLMGLFVLLTLLCVVRSARSRSPHVWASAAAFSCLFALASKEVAVSLPILVLLYDRAFLAGSFLGAWRARRTLYLALGVTWALFLLNQAHVLGRSWAGTSLPMPWWEYAMNQPTVILHYLRLVFWPSPLILDYVWPPAPSWGPLLPGFFVVGGLLIATLVALVRIPRWGFLGAFFFLILAPTSSVMPILDLAVEHRMYLPLAPVLAALVLGFDFLIRWLVSRRAALATPLRLAVLGGAPVVVALLGSLTVLRNEDYRSTMALWLDVVTKQPDNPRAHVNYARAFYAAGNLDKAIRQIRIALQLVPNDAIMHVTLGVYLEMNGQNEDAIQELLHATRISPEDPRPWMVLGETYAKVTDLERAKTCLRKALLLDPGSPQTHYELGNVSAARGEFDVALGYYQNASRLWPGFSPPHWRAGMVQLQQGRLPEAIKQFDAYIRLEPNTALALTQAGQAFYAYEKVSEALNYWRKALQLDPKQLSALLSMSWALSTNPQTAVRNGPEALALAETALQANQNRIPAILEALGAAYAELGRFPDACAVLEEAIQKVQVTQSTDLPGLQSRLALYRSAQPYRETPSRPKS